MKSETLKGIIYGEDYTKNDYRIIFGFYNDKSNKDQLVDTIWKIGDYTNKRMKGEIVNFFDNTCSPGVYGTSKTNIIEEVGITAGILHGSGLRFNGEVKAILERNGEAQKLRDMHKDITARKEAAGYDEQKLKSLSEYLQTQYGFSEKAAIKCVVTGDIPEEKEPCVFPNFAVRIPQVAKENGLVHLTLLPVYDQGSSLEYDIIKFLAAKREGRGNKPLAFYVGNGDSILFDDTIRSINMIQ